MSLLYKNDNSFLIKCLQLQLKNGYPYKPNF